MREKNDMILYKVEAYFDTRYVTDHMIETSAGPSDASGTDLGSNERDHAWYNRSEKQADRIVRELRKLADKLKVRIKVVKEEMDIEY